MSIRTLLLLTTALTITACDQFKRDWQAAREQVKQDAQTVRDNIDRRIVARANNFREDTKRSALILREWAVMPLPEDPLPKAVPDSYCYKVMQDIVCYRQPVQGWSHKLVGYQGPSAPTPPLAQTLPNPGSSIKKAPTVDAVEERVANAKPVFVKPPIKVKEDKTNLTLGSDILGSEPLPNPTLSPQL